MVMTLINAQTSNIWPDLAALIPVPPDECKTQQEITLHRADICLFSLLS